MTRLLVMKSVAQLLGALNEKARSGRGEQEHSLSTCHEPALVLVRGHQATQQRRQGTVIATEPCTGARAAQRSTLIQSEAALHYRRTDC